MADILNLPDWKVISSEEKRDTFYITAEVTQEPYACPRCGVLGPKLQKFGTHTQEIPDLPIRFKQTIIIAIGDQWKLEDIQWTILPPDQS